MRTSHARSYKNHFFFVTPRFTPDGKYWATFSVHKSGPGDVPPDTGSIRIVEGNSPELFDSERRAIDAADVRARAWIDANPLEK